MRIKYSVSALLLVLCFTVSAQTSGGGMVESEKNIGIEFQAYPAGIMPGLSAELKTGNHHSYHLRLGANIADRQDWGEHDLETGFGIGGTLGYRYYFGLWGQDFSAGLRADFWSMTIDWEDLREDTRVLPPNKVEVLVKGSSDILIFQPTFEVGWWTGLGKSKWDLGLTFTNGFEINVKTEGEEVGQGLITLLGINLKRQL